MAGKVLDPKAVHEVLGKTILVDGFDYVLDLEQSKGTFIQDAKTGRKFLDLFTFFASGPIGFNHPKLTSPAAKEALLHAATHKPSNSDVYTVPMADFVRTFRELAMPPSFRYAFFIEGGTLAVENTLKVAFDYKVQRNFARGATSEIGSKVIHFRNAFHGRSGYTLSLTNTLADKIAYFPKFPWPRFDTPGLRFPVTAEEDKRVANEEKRILQQIRWTGEKDGEDIAAIILEPIQSEGGDVHFRREFLQGLRDLCDEFDWLLIFDEVQTGFGITGKMWAHQHFGVEPDLVAFGKKSQVCGLMARETVDRVPKNVFHVPSRINSTWGGNLVDMVRCRLFLEAIHEEKMVENAAVQGKRLLDGLKVLEKDFSKMIGNARGLGLLCAFTFHDVKQRGTFLENMEQNGAMILPCGPASIRFRPPLNISAGEVDEALTLVKKSLAGIK